MTHFIRKIFDKTINILLMLGSFIPQKVHFIFKQSDEVFFYF